MSDSSDLVCPRCGAAVDASVAGGNCPACLLRAAALGTGADSLPAMPWTPPSVDELASAFPQLEVLELIGHGGMGAVYKARQKSLGRLVALKILAPQHAANPDFAERFAREAKVLAEVSHPNIVTVHDFGQAGQTEKFYFLTMEFVDGVNLRQAMKAGRLTPPQALAIVPPICEALQFAHDRGIVHRDIKPENLLLDKEGRVKIADFGIARMLRVGQTFLPDDPMPNANQAGNPDLRNTDLTQESVLGTPSYMAPEQRDRPASVDHRADIFSLGVVLYEMLTGELPGSKLQAPSRKVEIDVRLDEIVLRALEQQPELRFQTAAEFRTRVTSIANGDAAKPRSARLEVIPQPATQPFSARTSGVLMLLIGAFFVLAFLFGGGVATSTQGGTAVAIFFASYFLGLLFPGLLVYQSAVASTCHIGTPQPVSAKTKWTTQWPAIVLAILWIPVSMVFFRSEAFATPIGQNAFLIFMGVCLAQFIPLGLGILHRGSQPTDESQLSQGFQPSLEPKFGQVDHSTGNVPRFMRCHVTDLQRLATFSGQFFLWRNVGQLVLTETQLTITQGGQVFAIPLDAIRDLSIGHYPLLVNWAGLDFISVTYEVAGQQRQLVLSPYESVIGLPSQFNESVASWFEVIRAAVVTATGRAPARSQVQGFGTPASSRWTLALFSLMLTSLVVLPLVVFWNVAGASGLGPTPPLRNWAPILPLLGPALGLSLTAAIFWWIRVAETRRKAAKERAAGTSGDADSMGRAISATTDTSPPNSTVADALGFRTLWGKRLFQWSHLGFLGFLCFLSFVPGFERALGFSGFFGFFGFVGFAVMVEHWHRRHETQSPHGQIANERSQRHKIAFAASVVWLVTGIMVGTVKLRATEVRFRYDFEWLALTLFLLATAVLPGVLVSKSIKQWREKRDPQDRPPLFGWLRATAVLGFVMTLPFVMLTTGLLDGLFSQVLVWEGAMIVFLLPVGVIGFIALPWASVVLWQARFLLTAATGDPQVTDARQRKHRRIVIGTIVSMLVVVALMIVVPPRPQPVEVTTRHAAVENGHYTFEYSVQDVPGWNVWLTLENAQLIKSDSPHLEDRGPVVVSRYQAKLAGNGRVRIPLEYLPTTDEGLGKMHASLGPIEVYRIQLRPRQHFGKLAYQTESLMRVWAIMMMLPDGQTPDSLLVNEPTGSPASPRYKTIEPPAQPTLGPFEGTYEQGRVELLALNDHPPKGQPFWKPNGEPLTEAVPELGGANWTAGKAMKEIVVRVHSTTGLASTPVLRFRSNSEISAGGGSFHRPDDKQPIARFHGAIACPPQAREMTIEVGVADGDWRKAIEFARHDNQPHSGLSESGSPTRGTWAGSVRSASIVGDRVPIAFSYSHRDDHETRMTYERDDSTIVPLIGEGSDGNAEMINSLTTMPVAEFKRIKKFRVESRRYQWVEFRNVSLQLGHRTQVEVQNAGLFFPPVVKPIEEAASAKRKGEAPAEPRTANLDKIDTTPIIMKLIENEKFVRGFRVKAEAKIRQRVGNNFSLPEIEREIKTSFAIDERGRIRAEQTGGIPGRVGTTDVRQQHEVAVFDGVMLKLLQGPPNEPGNWGYHGRDKYRMSSGVNPRNYLLEHNSEPLREQISGGKYEAVGKEMWHGREVVAFESSTTTRESEKTSHRGRLLLDPSLGYAAVYRVSQIRFDDLGPDWYDFARYEASEYKPATGGLFVPGRAIYTSLLPNRDVIKAKQPIEIAWQHDIRFLDWELNPKFTDDDFQLDFPAGIFVMDETK